MNRRDMVDRLYAAVGRLLVRAMCVVDDVYRLRERLRRKRQEHPGPPI